MTMVRVCVDGLDSMSATLDMQTHRSADPGQSVDLYSA